MDKQILAIDSQILNTYQSCPCKTKYQFIDNIRPMQKEEAFDRGGLLHDMLKVHYIGLMNDVVRLKSMGAWLDMPHIDEETHLTGNNGYVRIVEMARKFGNFKATKCDLPIEVCDEVIQTYLDYAEHFRNDGWIPLSVETPFSVVLYENDELTILYEGIVDLVTQNLIVDHKSSKRRGEPSALSNQFMGYCWSLGINNLIVNKVGFQKSLKPKDKFERYTKSYPKSILEEWKVNTIRVALELYEQMKDKANLENQRNYTSCDKYSGCIYSNICLSEPEARTFIIQRDFMVGEPWKPTEELEK